MAGTSLTRLEHIIADTRKYRPARRVAGNQGKEASTSIPPCLAAADVPWMQIGLWKSFD